MPALRSPVRGAKRFPCAPSCPRSTPPTTRHDLPLEEAVTFRIDLYARENVLYQVNTALHNAMRLLGFRRDAQVQDDYLPEIDIYVKSVTYTIKVPLPFPWQ